MGTLHIFQSQNDKPVISHMGGMYLPPFICIDCSYGN